MIIHKNPDQSSSSLKFSKKAFLILIAPINQPPALISPCSQKKSASPRLRPRQTETRWTWRPSASSPRSSLLPSPESSTLPKNCPCSLRWVLLNEPRALTHTADTATPASSHECVPLILDAQVNTPSFSQWTSGFCCRWQSEKHFCFRLLRLN